MSRQQTNVSALDTEAFSMEPGKVLKKKNRVTCTEIWAGWFQLLLDLKKSKMGLWQNKKNHLQWWHSRAAQSLTGGVKAHLGSAPGSWQSNIHIQSAGAVIPDGGKPPTAQQAATRCPQHCHRTMTSAEHDKWNKGRPVLLNHTAQLVPIMPLVSGEAHRERCKTRKGQVLHPQEHKKAGRWADCISKSSLWMKCVDQC